MSRGKIASTPLAVVMAFLINALIGFGGGWVIAGPADSRRLPFSVAFALTLGLLGASSEFRRRRGRWVSIGDDVISAMLIVLLMIPVSRLLVAILTS